MQTVEQEPKSSLKTIDLQGIYKGEHYYDSEKGFLICSDTFRALKMFEPNSVDIIFADPPYFLSNNGISCHSGTMVSVNKGEWDKQMSFKEIHKFNKKWLKLCYDVLKPDGTIWISGTLHNIYSIGVALQECGFKIINNITWKKTNPPPNLSCKCFTHSTETILWAKKDIPNARPTFNYELMKSQNGGKQMKDVWEGSLTSSSEKKHGKHPTQKPLYLLNRIIQSSSKKGFVVLDPFVGSGTTAIAAITNDCYFIGIDSCPEYLEIAKLRIGDVL